jgi:hypothetical protein
VGTGTEQHLHAPFQKPLWQQTSWLHVSNNTLINSTTPHYYNTHVLTIPLLQGSLFTEGWAWHWHSSLNSSYFLVVLVIAKLFSISALFALA